MPARVWITGVAVALVATIALTAWGHPGSDYRHSDFFQFWAAPRLLLEGRDPYDATDWASIYQREAAPPLATPPPPGRHVYPPWSAVILLPLALLPFDLAAAAWVVAQLAAVVVALRLIAALYVLRPEERAVLFGLAAAFQPLWLIVGGGNISGFLFGLYAAGLAAGLARATVGGIPLGLVAVKPHPFTVAVPVLLWVSRARGGMIASGAGTVAVLVALTLPFGPPLVTEWISAALDLQGTTGSNATVWTIGRVLPGGVPLAAAVAGGAVAAFAAWWRVRRPEASAVVAGSVAISLFVAPHGWSYDEVLLLIPLAPILSGVPRGPGPRRLASLVAISLAAVVLPWALYALALARGGEEWSALTPLLFFALLVVTRWRAPASPPMP